MRSYDNKKEHQAHNSFINSHLMLDLLYDWSLFALDKAIHELGNYLICWKYKWSLSFSSLIGIGATSQSFINMNNTQQDIRKKVNLPCFADSTDQMMQDEGSGTHQFNIIPSAEPFSPVSETTVSTPVSHGEDSWGEAQDEGSCEMDDGPEYLAIGNLGHRDQSSSQCNNSSSSYSGSSQQFAPTIGQVPKVNIICSASLLSIPRSSSFSEIKTLERKGGFKKSHIRSRSDTGISSTNPPGTVRFISRICMHQDLLAARYINKWNHLCFCFLIEDC